MSSPQTHVAVDEEVPLTTTAGSGSTQDNKPCDQVVISSGRAAASCCHDDHHRKLAVASVICGISCIGISALIYSVKAEQSTDQAAAAEFTRRAKKWGIISIVTWVAILVLIPILVVLISYLITLKD